MAHHIEPIIRKRVIQTVSARFHAPVELDSLSVSAVSGLEVTATGLRVQYPEGFAPASSDPSPRYMIRSSRIRFHTGLASLLDPKTHIGLLTIEGLEIHIPPAGMRGALLPPHPSSPGQPEEHVKPGAGPDLFVNQILCTDALLLIDTVQPGKDPLEFRIRRLELTDVDFNRSFHYDASLSNPKPTGEIHAVGSFGPWQRDNPRSTAIDGDFHFAADLASIHGIRGHLTSTGHFGGQLQSLAISGITNTPDFALDTSSHSVPLQTQFQASVDATTGDTTLHPVEAHMLRSSFTAHGVVRNIHGQGHDITLEVDVPDGRIEDMLQLAVSTNPPLLRGALSLHTRLHIPPGPVRVAEKLDLAGAMSITHASFSNPQMQAKVDGLSLRAQGRPEDARDAAYRQGPDVESDMRADFTVLHAMTSIENLRYQLPGALVLMNGVYSLNGKVFEFKGHVRTDAEASQMVTGWKSILLMPLDPFLKKNHAGMELPIEISGTQGTPHIGLALHGADDSAQQLQEDLRSRMKTASPGARSH